jgi:ferredoxin-NADP reductase
VLLVVILGRWGRFVLAQLRPLRVAALRQVAPDVFELTLHGRRLRTLRADAGQFAMLRPLQRDLWWRPHPFSISAAPNETGLKFTIKAKGSGTKAFTELALGTRVAVEGPYGSCTSETIAGTKLFFLAGGVGVAPVRALLERASAGSQPVVVYRAAKHEDLVHLDELRWLAAERGGTLHTIVGSTARLSDGDPFSAQALLALAPDIAERTAVLCGPERLLAAARSGLTAAGVAREHIHYERPWW